jgi:hypothetical protein
VGEVTSANRRVVLLGLVIILAAVIAGTSVVLWDTPVIAPGLAVAVGGAIVELAVWFGFTIAGADAEESARLKGAESIAVALVWAAVILAFGVVLRGTPYFGQMIPIFGGGAAASIIVNGGSARATKGRQSGR